MSIRPSFVKLFGEKQAKAVEKAARYHANGINSARKGSDAFRWAITICLGYQCLETERYRDEHEITAPWAEVKEWIKTSANLGEHDGDIDYLSLLTGTYDEFVKREKKKT